jgi:hypothetical protein
VSVGKSSRSTPSGQPMREPIDERLQAFIEFLRSIDDRDHRAGVLAIRQLRQLGVSVCALARPGGGR